MNVATLIGRLTKEPELRQTPNGVSTARFTVAVNRKYKNDNGEYTADFISCVAWRQTAEFVSKYFHKGSMIALTGSIQSRSWEDKNGERRVSTEVVAESVYFTGEKPRERQDDFSGFEDISYTESDLPF